MCVLYGAHALLQDLLPTVFFLLFRSHMHNFFYYHHHQQQHHPHHHYHFIFSYYLQFHLFHSYAQCVYMNFYIVRCRIVGTQYFILFTLLLLSLRENNKKKIATSRCSTLPFVCRCTIKKIIICQTFY